jgi:hypothetical protein
MTTLIGLALWLAAAGQATLLVVSVQVPGKLQWRTQLARLDAANRKLYVVSTGYIVFTYLAFAVLTATLHDRFVSGEATAIGLSVFIGLAHPRGRGGSRLRQRPVAGGQALRRGANRSRTFPS